MAKTQATGIEIIVIFFRYIDQGLCYATGPLGY